MGCRCWLLSTLALVHSAGLAERSEGGPSSGCDLTDPALAGVAPLRERALRWYETGAFELGDANLVSSVLQARDELLHVCPVAVLQAILLKLEENIVYEPLAYQEMMGAYAAYLQGSVEAGSVAAADLRQWPLTQGLDRVLKLSKELAVVRPLTSAMVMNYCQPADRFGTIHDLDWLLVPPFGEPGVPDAGLLSDTELFIYLVDAPWCRALDPVLVAQLERVARRVHLVPYTGGPGREEQTAYFKFLADHYDSLPDFTIFVHPDAPEHQGEEFPALKRALRLIRTGSELAYETIGYYPLAEQMVVDPKRAWGSSFKATWRRFWRRVFGHSWTDLDFVPPRCFWNQSGGSYISGAVDGHEDPLTLPAAKALCASLPSCAGVTCYTPSVDVEDLELYISTVRAGSPSCTVRRGEPPEPLASPSELETSFRKRCAGEGGSAHLDADANASGPADDDRPAVFSRHVGAYLADYAAGDDSARAPRLARARCSQLGPLCGGITCDLEEARCTVRAGSELIASPYPEVSYFKELGGADGEADGVAPVVDAYREASDVFQFYTGSQSVVRRDRLRAWPREQLAAFGSEGEFCTEMSGYYEAAWHRMFGEPLSQWPRELDPRLPLHLKWGVRTKYSYGDEGVI